MHTNGYHTHKHNHCKHDFIRYCEHCDICYCTKCGKEWGEKVTFTYTYAPYVWTYRGVPYTATYDNGSYSLTTSNGTAVTRQDIVSAFNTSVENNTLSDYHVHSST